jgi:hypothetical protein
MPRVGFEPTIPVFERAKTVHDFDSAALWTGVDIFEGSSCALEQDAVIVDVMFRLIQDQRDLSFSGGLFQGNILVRD